jgi:hypothetical protein
MIYIIFDVFPLLDILFFFFFSGYCMFFYLIFIWGSLCLQALWCFPWLCTICSFLLLCSSVLTCSFDSFLAFPSFVYNTHVFFQIILFL